MMRTVCGVATASTRSSRVLCSVVDPASVVVVLNATPVSGWVRPSTTWGRVRPLDRKPRDRTLSANSDTTGQTVSRAFTASISRALVIDSASDWVM